MAYSIDRRQRVLDFIENGNSKVEAAKLFNISREVIYKWLNASDPLAPQKTGPKGPRCIDYEALTQHVQDFPDQTIIERANHFGVSYYCIWYGLRKLGISRKKTLGYKERCDQKRNSPDYNPIEHNFANIKRLREYNKDKTLEEIINMSN